MPIKLDAEEMYRNHDDGRQNCQFYGDFVYREQMRESNPFFWPLALKIFNNILLFLTSIVTSYKQ